MAEFFVEEDEKDFLVCGICFSIYDEELRKPKFLPCFDTFCLNCLNKLLTARPNSNETTDQTIQCPFCRQDCKIDSLDNLTTNKYVMPKVVKLNAVRKRNEAYRMKCQDNLKKTITLRKQLKHELKQLSFLIGHKNTENDMKIDALHAALNNLSPKVELENLPLKNQLCMEEELRDSKTEFFRAELLAEFIGMAKDTFKLILSKDYIGLQSKSHELFEQPFSFRSASQQADFHADANLSLFSFINHKLKDLSKKIFSENSKAQKTTVNTASSSVESRNNFVKFFSGYYGFRHNLLVYLTFRANGVDKPVVWIELNMKEAPIMGRQFLKYCRGENNMSFKGTRVVKVPSTTGGKLTNIWRLKSNDIDEEEQYIVDSSKLKEEKGTIRMEIRNRSEQGALVSREFSIVCSEVGRHPNKQVTTVFGRIIKGMEVCDEINAIDDCGDIVICDCGSW